MHARVATFELADQSKLDDEIDEMRRQSAEGPTEGIPAKEFLMLVDRDGGKVMAVMLFETEDDLRKGDETMNAMSPSAGGAMGRRTSVEMFEVPLHMG
ncbi:MAG TPA: hypothetical protein VGQ84_09960 [Gaiellaceae bacterium]|jgi:uncharacterized protein YcgI (DUF1989 family)|nr:hypothetical protein [Gaiellaceae bacterium]